MTNETTPIENPAVEAALLQAYAEDIKASYGKGGAVVISRTEHDEATVEAFVTDKTNAEKVTVYNQYDGVPSRVNVSMLVTQLRKRFPKVSDIPQRLWGKRAFDMKPPADLPEKAMYKCRFHKDSDRREEMNRFGLASVYCSKDNLASILDEQLHVEHKHPNSYKRLKEVELRAREDEDRQLRRAEVAAMQQLAAATQANAVAAAPAKAAAKAKEE